MASTADSVTQYGLSQIGKHYESGSAFTRTAYAAVGIQIPRTAIAQAYRAGMEIKRKADLAEGDLVFPTVRIVGLYVGGGYWLAVVRSTGTVQRVKVGRMWRGVRVATPGGGRGLALAVPGSLPRETVSGKRPRPQLRADVRTV